MIYVHLSADYYAVESLPPFSHAPIQSRIDCRTLKHEGDRHLLRGPCPVTDAVFSIADSFSAHLMNAPARSYAIRENV